MATLCSSFSDIGTNAQRGLVTFSENTANKYMDTHCYSGCVWVMLATTKHKILTVES